MGAFSLIVVINLLNRVMADWIFVLLFITFVFVLKFLLTDKRPKLRLTNNEDIKSIASNCNTFKQRYIPTFWCFLGHPMTLFAALARYLLRRDFPYEREVLRTFDG